MDQGLLDENVFAFFLGDNEESELSIGGVDETKFKGEIHKVDLVKPKYWEIMVDRMSVGDYEVTTDVTAIVDSGTSLLIGPTKYVSKIAFKYGATKMPFTTSYLIGCDTDITDEFTLTIDSKNYTIQGSDLIIPGDDDDTICLFGFSTMDRLVGPQFILGDVFMRRFYTVFDIENKQVGFAELA